MPDRHTPRQHRRGAAGDWPGRPAEGGPAVEGAEAEAEVERLRAALEAAQAEATEHLAALQRTAADFANFRRRTAEDREREAGLADESLLRKLLVIADDFDRALEAMPEELSGVGWIEGIGLLDGEVVAEMLRGYRVRDRVLRPAMVAVAGGGAAPGGATSEIN
jgi:molecular chaperone GrpE (heat shock protein)